jgi:hypothetical protein
MTGPFAKGLLEAIADGLIAIQGESGDVTEPFDRVAEFLSVDDRGYLAEMLDLCPVHYCDVQICADDDGKECESARTEGWKGAES